MHQGTHKALRHGSHSFTCKQHHACLSVMAFTRCHHHSNWGSRHPISAHYSLIDPERMKGWVGLVGWPIADGLPTSGHPSATSRAQDSESTSAKDRCSTAGIIQGDLRLWWFVVFRMTNFRWGPILSTSLSWSITITLLLGPSITTTSGIKRSCNSPGLRSSCKLQYQNSVINLLFILNRNIIQLVISIQ